MEVARPHPEEATRLETLRSLNILDTDTEERFDRLTDLVATALDVPIALVSLIDQDRQWFKSCIGLDVHETPRDIAFCAHAIVADNRMLLVPDARLDPRFRDNPLVTGDPDIRFYAGRVVHAEDGSPLGTLCAIDRRPRHMTATELAVLDQLARLVELELRRTSHARLTADLFESERRRAAIFDTVSEGFILRDVAGQILDWNPAAERLLGLTGDELRGRSAFERPWHAFRIDGTPYPAEERPSMRALTTGTPVDGETYGVRHTSGRTVWLRVSARPVTGTDGRVDGVVASFADVTVEIDEARRRRELEAELERNERTARVSLDALEQGVILAGAGGAIPRLNPAAVAILGYSGAELTEKWQAPDWVTWDEHGVVLEGTDRPILRALATGEPVIGQIIGWRRKDGEQVLLRMSCVPNVDGDRSIVITFIEVTAEYQARRLLDTVLEVAPVGLAVLGENGTIMRTNQRFADQVGCKPEDLVGEPAVDLVHADDLDEAARIARGLVSGNLSRASFEHRVVTADGAERWVETSLAVTEIGESRGSVVASFDVTDRRAMLQELARYGHLFRNADDVIVVLDAAGRVVLASPSAERMCGSLVGCHVTSVVHPDDRDIVLEAIGPGGDGVGESEQVVLRILDIDGEIVQLECVGINLLEHPAVRGIVVTGRDVTTRIEITSQIERQATRDTLTDLANRHHLQRIVEQKLADRVDDTPIGLLFIDLDNFKQINDTHGHTAGDRVIRQIAALLQKSVRANDIAARVGGDEFVVLLDAVNSAEQALAVASRFRDALEALPSTNGPLGASIGVTTSQPGDTFSTLIDRADAAMYRAKTRPGSAIELALGDTFVAASSPEIVSISAD